MDLFVRELFATRISAFFAFDVVVSALALFVFVFGERKTTRVRHLWLPLIATVVVGVSLGLPLFLYLRQRSLDAGSVRPSAIDNSESIREKARQPN